MKHKLLNKLWLRVGMIVAVMTTALSGTVWAETVTVSYGWETADDATKWTITDAITATSGQGNTGTYAGKINTNHTYVQFKEKVNVTSFSFAFKRTTNNNNYNVYIETSTDGSTWNAVETYAMSSFSNGSYSTKTHTFDGKTQYYVRFHCDNTTAVRYVDDVSITYTTSGGGGGGDTPSPTEGTGTITFGTGKTAINSASVTGDDDLGNTWTITTVGTTSFTANSAYYQVGSGNSPATSITFTTTLASELNITAMSAKFGGFSNTAGTVTLKVGDTTVGTGSLNGTSDVTVNSTSAATGTVLTVTVTGISRGVKCYYISYTCTSSTDPTCETPTFSPAAGTYTSAQNVTISTETAGATIYYTTDGTDPTTSSTQYSGAINVSSTTTIKAIAAAEDHNNSSVAEATYNIVTLEHAGTEADPYTVADARNAIDAGIGTTGVYATGIVCRASSSLYSDKYLSYYISADGTTESPQLEAYNGLGLNGADFTSVDDIKVGDVVVIYGDLTKYNTTYEFAADNYLVSHDRPKINPTIPVEDSEVVYGSKFTVSGVVGGDISVTSSNTAVATINGLVITPVAVGTTTITVATAGNDTYNAGSETFELTVTAPEGQGTAPSAVGGTIFEETFADCVSTGGNDNNFATASNTEISNANDYTDNDGWVFSKGYPAKGCVKFGGSSAKGEAATPSITATVGTTYTLTFKAAPWSSESATMNVSVDGGTISGISEDAMSTGEWNDFTASITATATSFTVTFAASKNRFFLDEVKIEAPATPYTESYTIPSSGLGTYCSEYPLDLDELPEGVKAYAVTAKSSSSVTLTQVTGTVKGGTGLVFEGTGGDVFDFTFADSDVKPSNNMLKGTLAPEYLAAGTAYGLKSGVFQPNSAGTIKANRAYLPAGTGAVKALTLVFEDDATGITHTRVITDEATIYDLTGRRLNQMQKGINIVNGKKILK